MPKKPASAPTINPPEGWKDGEGFGFLYGRNAQGQPVDLVRLSDLVPWLQQRDKLSFADAVRAVMDAMPGDVMQWLFRMEPSNAATVVLTGELFGFTGLAGLAKARCISVDALQADLARRNREHDALELQRLPKPRTRYVIAGSDAAFQRHVRLQHEWPQEPGRPALLRYLGWVQASPPTALNDKRAVIAFLAIPRAMAHTLFCWGTVVDESKAMESAGLAFDFSQAFIALCEARKTRKGDAWTNDEKATLQAEVKRFPNRAKGLREAIAQALGLGSAEAVSLILREYKQAQDDARKAAANVVQVRDGKKSSSV